MTVLCSPTAWWQDFLLQLLTKLPLSWKGNSAIKAKAYSLASQLAASIDYADMARASYRLASYTLAAHIAAYAVTCRSEWTIQPPFQAKLHQGVSSASAYTAEDWRCIAMQHPAVSLEGITCS